MRAVSAFIIGSLFALAVFTGHVACADEGTEKWRFGSDLDFYMAVPAVGPDGTIYASVYERATASYALYAINPNGTQKWRFETDGSASSPTIGPDGTVYAGAHGNKLYAINPENGAEKWRFDNASFYAGAAPVIDRDGTIYIGWGDNLFAFSPSGRKKWELWLHGSQFINTPAVGPDGTIYAGGDDGSVYAVSLDGTEKWRFDTGGASVRPAPCIGPDGTIYIGSGNENFYALNPDGTKRWHFETGEFITASAVIGPDGTIYVGSDKFYALNPDGTRKWDFSEGLHMNESAAIGADGNVYVAVDGDLYALKPDGSERWHFQGSDPLYTSAAMDLMGTVYVGSYTCLYAVNTAAGGLADAPWPMFQRNLRHTGRQDMFFRGDVNGDGLLTLADPVFTLRALCGMATPPVDLLARVDVNGNGKIGVEEALYDLAVMAGLRPSPLQVPLWPDPVATGQVREFSRNDGAGNSWTATDEILEEVNLNGKTYFHIRTSDIEPGEVDNFYARLTDDAVYVSGGGPEILYWQAGPIGTTWVFDPEGTLFTIKAVLPVTVPFGGPFMAYVLEKYKTSENAPCLYSYFIPGFGVIKEVDHWVDNPPLVHELVSITSQ